MGCRQPIHALATGASQQAEDRGLIGAEESNQGRGIVLQHDANTAKRFSPRSRYVKPLFVVGARLGRPLMGGWIPFPQGLIGGSDPAGRESCGAPPGAPALPPRSRRRRTGGGGRSLHDGPSGASPAGRVNGPQGRIFLPGGGWRGSPLPFTGADSGHLAGTAGLRRRGGASGRKPQGPHHLGALTGTSSELSTQVIVSPGHSKESGCTLLGRRLVGATEPQVQEFEDFLLLGSGSGHEVKGR